MDGVESWSSETEQFSSEIDDSSQYEMATDTVNPSNFARIYEGGRANNQIIPSATEHPASDLIEELAGINIITVREDYGPSALMRVQQNTVLTHSHDLNETLLSSPKVSPPASTRSAALGHGGGTNEEFMVPDQGPGSDGLSSRTSATARYNASQCGEHWVYASDVARWTSLAQVGRVLDVLGGATINMADENSACLERSRKSSRRMVVVKVFEIGFCGVPVRTYRRRGVRGLSKDQVESHAVLHVKGIKPELMRNEPIMSKLPLATKNASKLMRLSPASRINFAKPSLVDSSYALSKVARIDSSSMSLLESYWLQHLS